MGEQWFGHYRLDRLLGSGGTGQVWLARDTSGNRDVALKILATGSFDVNFRERFAREARFAAQVRGPHVAEVHGFGELDGRLYLAMEFIEGATVGALLRAEGPMAPERAVEVIWQTAVALDAVHRAGLVHRDVKPSNIMVGSDGFVHLIDFGTAHRPDQPAITASGNVIGTLEYMAPERFDGEVDDRSDQYSLACVLYECLTARRPFGRTGSAQQLRAHLTAEPPRAALVCPEVPAALDAVIARGMAKHPQQRWPSVGAFASAAKRAMSEQHRGQAARHRCTPVVTAQEPATPLRSLGTLRPVTRPEVVRSRRETRSAVLAIAALMLLAVGAVWWGRPDHFDTHSASMAITTTPTTEAPGILPPESPPASAELVAVPTVGHPCDPVADTEAFAVDGTPLVCVAAADHSANWVLAPHPGLSPAAPGPQQDSSAHGEHHRGHVEGGGGR
ncbi:serine/threonine-protein kinase [Nocardia callitridis]|uniref:non-specific serine/threonine protein kinase n=1 Tax=Nocardia callitridis TaxID=648753 RepID=A0ABP9L226_9NOCA